jgi:bifunctional non-homologous end joining protein LigD
LTVRAGVGEFFGRAIDVSSVDRVVFPDLGLTKGELVAYYVRIAETMLPHLAGRPVAVKRYPRGLGESGFFQKNAGKHFPDWLRRLPVAKREGGFLDHPVIDEPATIVFLADQGTIEFHPWLATADDLEHPDQLIFDLDPPDADDPAVVRRATRQVRAVLDELGLQTALKTSGSKGFHVHVPLDRTTDWSFVRRFAADVAAVLAARHPGELTDQHRKAGRHGRVFVDHFRNRYGQTSVAAYSVRARPGAPVATPIEWDELARVAPRTYTVKNVFRRLGQRPDPWRDGWGPGQSLHAARATLDDLLTETRAPTPK